MNEDGDNDADKYHSGDEDNHEDTCHDEDEDGMKTKTWRTEVFGRAREAASLPDFLSLPRRRFLLLKIFTKYDARFPDIFQMLLTVKIFPKYDNARYPNILLSQMFSLSSFQRDAR